MNATTIIVVGMFLLVGCSVLIGELFVRLGQAALVGQLLVGVILGPTVLAGPLGLTSIATSFSALQVLATFFILVMAGMAITPQQIRSTGLTAGVIGIVIFIVPFLVGAEIVRVIYPALPTIETLFVSLTISITALPVLGVMLREFDLLESRFGAALMNSAMINELCAVTVFAVLLQIYSHPNAVGLSIATAAVTTGLFLSSILAVYFLQRSLRQLKVWDRMVERFRQSWRSREGGFAVLMVIALGAALYSQLLGLTYLVGAFFCGLLITPESAGRREHRSISFIFESVTWGFFIPLFFALVGFSMDLKLIGFSVVPIVAFLALVVYAIFSKIFAGAGIARLLGWSANESLAAGFFVSSRGAVSTAMAVILLNQGIYSTKLFTIVAAVGLITTIVSPIGARPFVRSITAAQREADEKRTAAAFEPGIPPRRLINR